MLSSLDTGYIREIHLQLVGPTTLTLNPNLTLVRSTVIKGDYQHSLENCSECSSWTVNGWMLP